MWFLSEGERKEKILAELQVKIWNTEDSTQNSEGILLDFLTGQDSHAPKIGVYQIKNGEKIAIGKLFGAALLDYCEATNFVEVSKGKFDRFLERSLDLKISQVFFSQRLMKAVLHYSTEI